MEFIRLLFLSRLGFVLYEEWSFLMSVHDVIVVGAGNAAYCAALSAQEQGARVLMLEAAPEDAQGGNSRFASGVLRFAFRGPEDVRRLVPECSESEVATFDFGRYTEEIVRASCREKGCQYG